MIRVQEADFDVGAEIARLTEGRTGVGGVCAFVGLVRDMAGETPVEQIELEHYPAMTESELKRIESEARSRWPLDDVLIVHRFGRLDPGERIVLVVTTSAHRSAAFRATEFLIDWLKTKAPFWKRETTPGGENWVAAKESDDEAAQRWSEPAPADAETE